MAVRTIPTDRVARDVLEAMFPRAVRDDAVDLNMLLRECQFSAQAILTAADPDRGAEDSLTRGQAILAAQAFVNASIAVLGCFEIYGWPESPVIPSKASALAEPA